MSQRPAARLGPDAGGPSSDEPAVVLAQLDRRLERLVRDRPKLTSALELQRRLAREGLIAARNPKAPPLDLPPQRGWAKLGEGVPLLDGLVVDVDVAYAGDLFRRLVNVVSATPAAPAPDVAEGVVTPIAERIGRLVDAASSGHLDPYAVFHEAFVQHCDHLQEIAAAAGIDPDLLVVLAGLAVGPLLRAYARPLATVYLSPEAPPPGAAAWRKGYCPVCGAWPILGELRGLELQRHLRCGACGTSWPSRRLTCVYCAAEDFRVLERLQADSERRLAVDVCRRCQGYLKVLNTFTPTPGPLLALEDVASAHLDVAAIERGYRRPASQGYRVETAVEVDGDVDGATVGPT